MGHVTRLLGHLARLAPAEFAIVFSLNPSLLHRNPLPPQALPLLAQRLMQLHRKIHASLTSFLGGKGEDGLRNDFGLSSLQQQSMQSARCLENTKCKHKQPLTTLPLSSIFLHIRPVLSHTDLEVWGMFFFIKLLSNPLRAFFSSNLRNVLSIVLGVRNMSLCEFF